MTADRLYIDEHAGLQPPGGETRPVAADPDSGKDVAETASAAKPAWRWHHSPFILTMGTALLLWIALPPLAPSPFVLPDSWYENGDHIALVAQAAACALVGWMALVPLLALVRSAQPLSFRGYLSVYAVSFVYWFVLLQGMRLAHWATYFGWVGLSLYIAVYFPVFVWICRRAVHDFRVPFIIAAPATWVGLELVRGHIVTGFSVALVAHTQAPWPLLIQVSDLAGAYAVSFALLLFAACIAQTLPISDRGDRAAWSFRPLLPAGITLAVVAGYGFWRLQDAAPLAGDENEPPLRAALIQGSIDTEFDGDPERPARTFKQYLELSRQAVSEHDDLDVLIWPESVFTQPDVTWTEDATVPPSLAMPRAELLAKLDKIARVFDGVAYTVTVRDLKTPMLVGGEVTHYGANHIDRYNSAFLISGQGRVTARYDKMHPVMFGEYVPGGNYLPWLYRLTPMTGGITSGRQPESFEVASYRLSPSICFENIVPHLICQQVAELRRRGEEPDVLVTLTNDGWFWGSSILDLHLICGVFRAVENRKPMVVAANTGISAHVDAAGRMQVKGPRRDTAVLIANVRRSQQTSLYTRIGDWPAFVCATFCVMVAAGATAGRLFGRR